MYYLKNKNAILIFYRSSTAVIVETRSGTQLPPVNPIKGPIA